jgi:hypothetical protein
LLSFEEMQLQKCTQASFFSGEEEGKKIGVGMNA